MNHVDEITGLLYIESQLEPAAARGVVAHLEHCGPCRQLLDALKRESLLLSHALTEEDETVPARLLAFRPAEGLSWGWLTVFALAAVGVYTLWTFYMQPWMESLQESGFGGQFFFTWLLLNGAIWKGWNDMLQFLILSSLGVLAFVLLFLFRRNLRRLSSLSIFLGVLLLPALVHAPAAQAAEFVKNKTSYEVPAGETRQTDLFVVSSAVRVDGTIDGDLFCACHTLTIEGHVTGDVIAFANTVLITGKVDGNVRTFNENLTLEGEVGRNVMSFVGQFRTTPRSNVKGSATLFASNMVLDGQLGRSLSAFLGDGTINSPIGGDVRIYGGSGHGHHGPLLVASRADIKGSFRYKGPRPPDISSQARLASAPQVEIVTEPPEYMRSSGYRYNALIWGAGFVVGLFLISVAPGLVRDASREVARIGAPLGFGLVTFIVMPVAAVLACITVVGLGLGISALFLWLFLIFFAQIFVAAWLGEAMLGASSGTWPMTGRLALGLFILRLGALIPYLGGWVRFLSCVLGMGAIALVVYRRLQSPAAPPHLPAAPLSAAPAA
jgi:cytoskeletal protein CcmA (bactofilin family)